KAKSDTDTEATASPTKEGDVSRSPDRVISGVGSDRAGPPDPIATINEPPSVVIRRPAPGLIGNPRPAVVRLINPAAGAVRRPARSLRGNPHATVVGDFGPHTIAVEIFRADVVGIRFAPAFRIADGLIAGAIPIVPVILFLRAGDLVLGRISAGDGNHLSLFNACSA